MFLEKLVKLGWEGEITMKYPVIFLLLAGFLLTGCNSIGNSMESAVHSAGNAVERIAGSMPTEQAAKQLTREQAEAIALEHAGFTTDQVSQLHTEYEIDEGIPRFEVQFRQGRWEYDYEIHAQTGAILSYDRDD